MDEKALNRIKVTRRAKNTIRRLINSNIEKYFDVNGEIYTTKFLTLTFRENILDISYANYEYEKFIKRLNYYIGYKNSHVKFIKVLEFQKRGAVHFHVVFFNMPYIEHKIIEMLWGNGFVSINNINECDNIGAYVTKYMGKDSTDERLIGEKCYSSSRGLFKPTEITNECTEEYEDIEKELCRGHSVYESSYENEYIGKVTFRQYNIKRT